MTMLQPEAPKNRAPGPSGWLPAVGLNLNNYRHCNYGALNRRVGKSLPVFHTRPSCHTRTRHRALAGLHRRAASARRRTTTVSIPNGHHAHSPSMGRSTRNH